MRKLILLAFGWVFFLAGPAADAATFDFNLTRSPEGVGSWYRPSDDAIKFYDVGTVFTLELPSSDGTVGGIQTGTARITDFSLPGKIDNIGLYFEFTSNPSPLVGTVTVSGNEAEIEFPNVSVDFERGSNFFNTNPGTLLFTLTTHGTTIPTGCAGRMADQVIPGISLDLTTGELGLVASVCPYEVDNGGTPVEYDNAFRLALRGGLIFPECDDQLDNDGDGLTDFPDDPGCDDALDNSESAPASKAQQACVNAMNKSGAKVNKTQLKEIEGCLKDYQKGKLTTSFEFCTADDRKGKVDKAIESTLKGEAKKCDPLDLPLFGYTDSATVNAAAVTEALALVDAIFGDPAQDGDLFTKTSDKNAAACQSDMLKQASKLEQGIVKELLKAKKTALKDETVNRASALAAELGAVFTSNTKITKAEEKFVKGVEKKCGSLSPPASPDTVFPGACADPDLQVVESCVIAAARCRACRKIDAFDDLGLACDQLDNGSVDASCP